MNSLHIPVVLFNGTIVTTNGQYDIRDIDVESAKKLIQGHGFISAIGHEATAQVLTELLEIPIPMNRIEHEQEVGQIAIIFKLNVRPMEGVILTKKELLEIGYKLKIMRRID